MLDICNVFLEEEQPVNYENMLFWQKLCVIHLLKAPDCFLGFEVQHIPAEASHSLNTYFQNTLERCAGKGNAPTYSVSDFCTTRTYHCSFLHSCLKAQVLLKFFCFVLFLFSTGNYGLEGWAVIGTSTYFPVISFQPNLTAVFITVHVQAAYWGSHSQLEASLECLTVSVVSSNSVDEVENWCVTSTSLFSHSFIPRPAPRACGSRSCSCSALSPLLVFWVLGFSVTSIGGVAVICFKLISL